MRVFSSLAFFFIKRLYRYVGMQCCMYIASKSTTFEYDIIPIRTYTTRYIIARRESESRARDDYCYREITLYAFYYPNAAFHLRAEERL